MCNLNFESNIETLTPKYSKHPRNTVMQNRITITSQNNNKKEGIIFTFIEKQPYKK